MTKPLVDKGIFNRLDVCLTPWPSFVLAIREEIIEQNRDKIKNLMHTINDYCKNWMINPNAIALTSERFSLEYNDIEEWFATTKWSTNNLVIKKDFDMVVDTLFRLGLVSHKIAVEDLCDSGLSELI